MPDLKRGEQQSSHQHCTMYTSSKKRGSTTQQAQQQQLSKLVVEQQPHYTAPAPMTQQLRVTFGF